MRGHAPAFTRSTPGVSGYVDRLPQNAPNPTFGARTPAGQKNGTHWAVRVTSIPITAQTFTGLGGEGPGNAARRGHRVQRRVAARTRRPPAMDPPGACYGRATTGAVRSSRVTDV